MRFVFFLRHAATLGDILTEAGMKQANELGLRIAEFADHRHFTEWLVATSCRFRALDTAIRMNEGSFMPMAVRRELAETKWKGLETHAQALIRKFEALTMAEVTNCVVVITHEEGPWYLAQAALDSAEKMIPPPFAKARKEPDCASGFLVDLWTGGVRKVSWDQPFF